MSGEGPRTTFTCDAPIHATEGPTSWHFAHLPHDVADEIADLVELRPRAGFGSVRVEVTIGTSTWRTSLFPSKCAGTYVLPLKRPVRDAADLGDGDTARLTLRLLD